MDLSDNEYRILRKLLAESPDADTALRAMLDLYNRDNDGHTALLHHLCRLHGDSGTAHRILSDFYSHRGRWAESLPHLYRGVAAGLDPRSYYPLFLTPLREMLVQSGLDAARRNAFTAINEAGLLTASDVLLYDAEGPDPAEISRALSGADARAAAARPEGRPTYGLLMCNYNDAAHLPRSLTAIAAQSRSFDEIVLVDDGSTDTSLEVIGAFADRLPQLRLHRLERNVGVVKAYDIGLGLVTTDFVHLAAADDLIRPAFLEQLAAAADRAPATGAVFSHFEVQQRVLKVTDESWRLNPWADFHQIAGHHPPSRIFDLLSDRLIWINGNSAIYRTDALRALTEAVPAHGYLADWLAGIRIMLTHGASFVPQALSEYSVDEDRFAFQSMNDPARNAAATTSVIRSILKTGGNGDHELVRGIFLLRPILFEHLPGFVTIFLPATPGCAGLWLAHLDYYLSRGKAYTPRP